MNRRNINIRQCQVLLDAELALFNEEYDRHFLEGESKPKHIGQPYLLHHPYKKGGVNKAVLLVHGLMAAPEEVRQWADYLFAQGYTVYAPRLAGHGTSALDLSTRTMDEWADSVQRGHEILKNCSDEITIAGFSTGAALTLHHAIQNPEDFNALISISAPLKFKKFSAHFAKPVNYWNRVINLLRLPNPKKEYVTNHADNPHINYLRCPVSSIVQIQRLMKGIRKGLASIEMPSLMIHANGDPKVDVESSQEIYDLIGSESKQYHEIDFDLHGIIRGEISGEVFGHVGAFLKNVHPNNATGFKYAS